MSSVAIFDRIEIVQLLRDTCFAEGGTSSAITCTQKSGKSYLLQHVYESHSAEFIAGQKVIFCTLNLDLLKSMVQTQPCNPDQMFLLFFCRRLQEQLEIWVEDLGRGEAERQAMIQELMLKAALAADSLKIALDLKKDSLQLQQTELERLRVILLLLNPLAAGSTPIDIPTVMKVLDKLKRIQKRIILFIDDFDRMVKKNGVCLSDGLFNFLRGASTEKKLVTLVASNLHPMDPELHENNERPALFNHFQVQHLAPFTPSQAAEFLASWLSKPWLAMGRPVLSDEQIGYLVDLAGGCPYYLETAPRMFEMHDRPPTAKMTRTELENVHIMPLLEPAFLQIWRRCSPDQRLTLRSLATGQQVILTNRTVQNLAREGYIIMNGDQVKPFSRLFTNFVKSADDPPLRPDIKAVLNYKVFPTALAVAQPAENHPLISFTLDNPTSSEITVTLECELKQYGNQIKELQRLERRTNVTVDMRFSMQHPFPISFDTHFGDFAYSAWLELPSGGRTPLAMTVKQLRILPIDTFVFARRDDSGKRLVDWSWMIAAWVSKNQQGPLQAIIQKARELNGGEARGYAVAGDVRDGVRAQVKALYDALQTTARISYDDSATVFHLDGKDYAQRVRLPSRALKDGAANCLDGSVLFASLLATIGLHPIILLLPRHAIVGWKQEDSEASDLEFLETTLLRKEDFATAHQAGMACYAAVKPIADKWQYSGEIADTREFAIPIDVEKEWERREVVSLPWE